MHIMCMFMYTTAVLNLVVLALNLVGNFRIFKYLYSCVHLGTAVLKYRG